MQMHFTLHLRFFFLLLATAFFVSEKSFAQNPGSHIQSSSSYVPAKVTDTSTAPNTNSKISSTGTLTSTHESTNTNTATSAKISTNPAANKDCPNCKADIQVSAQNQDVKAAFDELKRRQYDLPPEVLKRLKKEAIKQAKMCRKVEIGTFAGKKIYKTICGDQRSKGVCNKAVKQALFDSHLTQYYSKSVAAVTEHRLREHIEGDNDDEEKIVDHPGYLQSQGFENKISDFPTAESAPWGAVLVYEGGRAGMRRNGKRRKYSSCEEVPCGHVENKLGDDYYSSDYRSDSPVGGTHRLVGVYVKTQMEDYWKVYQKGNSTDSPNGTQDPSDDSSENKDAQDAKKEGGGDEK